MSVQPDGNTEGKEVMEEDSTALARWTKKGRARGRDLGRSPGSGSSNWGNGSYVNNPALPLIYCRTVSR